MEVKCEESVLEKRELLVVLDIRLRLDKVKSEN